MLCLFIVNIGDVLAPIFMAVAVDLTEAELSGGVPQTTPLLGVFGLSSSLFAIGSAVALFLGLRAAANLLRFPMLTHTAIPSQRIGQHIRNQLVDKMMRLSRPFYDRTKSGDLMSLATADVQAVRMMLGPGILVGADTLMLYVLVIATLLTLSWQLTLIAMLPLPIIGYFTNKMSHAEYQRFDAVQEDLANLTERTRESFSGIRIIQGYAIETFDRARFRGYSARHYDKNLALARIRAFFEPTLDLMMGISMVLVLIFGGIRVVDGETTLGTFVAFLFLVNYLSGPMIGFGWAVSLFQQGRASLHRLDRLFAEPVVIQDGPEALESGPGRLELRELTFGYGSGGTGDTSESSRAALSAVNIDVPAGQTLGVIGPVGAGKSTLINLMVRLYDPPPGTIFLDGQDIRAVSLDALRAAVVLAPQETFLFSSTVGRNVTLAYPGPLEDAPRFAKLAHIHDEIDELPMGYSTLLGERGVNLSGGQRQRVAIARAIATNPRVLILDDCLSAVDARTEEAILNNLREIFEGRTGVIVSHRVRAVQDCAEIIVLDEGHVIERGTHDELLTAGGYYAHIAAEQTRLHDDDGNLGVGEDSDGTRDTDQ